MNVEPIVVLGCFSRALAFLHTAPVFAEDGVPERARLALAFLLALILAPAGGLPGDLHVRLALESVVGAALGLALAWPWATATALLPQLASAAGLDDDDEASDRLATAVALAAFLSLHGERYLITLLAAPCHVPGSAGDLAALALRSGGALFALAADGLVPLLAVLGAARVAGALVMRGGAMDLSGIHTPVLTVAGVALLLAYVHQAPLVYQDAIDEGAAQSAPRKGPR